MSADRETRGEWEFYPCQVDDRPASILLDLRYASQERPEHADTLYALPIQMVDAGEHGMGAREEAELLYDVEDALVESVRGAGLIQVGRLRSAGRWQLAFMGSANLEAILHESMAKVLEGREREYEVLYQHDPDWSYYGDFLLPDPERYQWIMNSRVVRSLEQHGDSLTEPRDVEHFIYFEKRSQRRAFKKRVSALGMKVHSVNAKGGERPHCARISYEGNVDLDSIHAAVMLLKGHAEECLGYYDGWETVVVKTT